MNRMPHALAGALLVALALTACAADSDPAPAPAAADEAVTAADADGSLANGYQPGNTAVPGSESVLLNLSALSGAGTRAHRRA